MGTYAHGINGPFKGKVGSVIGSSWNGQPTLKGLYNTRRDTTPTPEQQTQQNKFKLMAPFLRKMKLVIKLGFDLKNKKLTSYSKAMSYAIKNAIDLTADPIHICYSKILLTRGSHPNADNVTVTPGEDGMIVFTWTDNTGQRGAKANDKLVMVAYSPSMDMAVISSEAGTRSAGAAPLSVDSFKGQTIETYLSFVTADGSDVATSLYTGQVTVPKE